MRSANPLQPAVLLASSLALFLSLPGCGGNSETGNGDPPPALDTTPPFTQALPPGGVYSSIQQVTLTSNEVATIYYTIDGSVPSPGGTTTLSGVSPISGIVVNHQMALSFMGIDEAGNEEIPKTELYDIDTDPPNLFLGTFTSPLAMLEVGELNFVSDEAGTYTVEVGGTGESGSGAKIDSGVAEENQVTNATVPGWVLEQGETNTLWVYVHDAAGGYGSLDVDIDSVPEVGFAMLGESGDLVTTADGRFLFVARPEQMAVWRYDADPLSPTYHQLLESIAVGSHPSSLAITSDDAYLYVTCDARVDEIAVDTGGVITIPIPGGHTPSGVALMPDRTLAYVAGDDGYLWSVNIDQGGGSLHSVQKIVTQNNYQDYMTAGRLAINEQGDRLVMAWTGDGPVGTDQGYGVVVLDVDPTGGFYHGVCGILVSPSPKPVTIGISAIASDGITVYLGDASGRLAKALLTETPPAIVLTNNSLSVRAIELSLDGQYLLLHGGSLNGIRIAEASSLQLIHLVPTGGTGGTGNSLAFSADGKRAYLAADNGSAEARMWVPVVIQ